MTKVFINEACQGDVAFMRVEKLPEGLRKVKPKNGVYIIAHSETGHHHVIDANESVVVYESDNPMISYLEVIEVTDKVECLLRHLREFDTHETLKFLKGFFKISHEREYSLAGWRKASD